jgi:hypothetical protein
LKTNTAARNPPTSSGASRIAATEPTGSLAGSGLTVCTVTGRLSVCAAERNAASSSVKAKKLFAGTTVSVSLELPVTYAP